MKMEIWPRSEEDRSGCICMPAAKNIHKMDTPENVQRRHPSWKLVKCPVCGEGCYESEEVRRLRANGVDAACTDCAIKKGLLADG